MRSAARTSHLAPNKKNRAHYSTSLAQKGRNYRFPQNKTGCINTFFKSQSTKKNDACIYSNTSMDTKEFIFRLVVPILLLPLYESYRDFLLLYKYNFENPEECV